MLSRLSNVTNAQVGLLLGILAVVGLGISASAHIIDAGVSDATKVTDWWSWIDGAFQNFSTEVIGAILTFGLIEVLVGSRDRRVDEEARRKTYQLQAISELRRAKSKDDRQPILDRMTADGLLNTADLRGADLSGAILSDKNLQWADLSGADLQGADLRNANLQGADLRGAKLQGANLRYANLEGAKLHVANLQAAYLFEANLQRAKLTLATLPDGTEWTKETELDRFTDEGHLDFEATLDKIDKIRREIGLDLLVYVQDDGLSHLNEVN